MKINKDDGRAVVIGASISGLLAAKVLSKYFNEVILIDRDCVQNHTGHRKGVPQSKHAHGLLAKGLEVFESLFPGITDDLIELGFDYGDVGTTALWHVNGGFHAKGLVQENTLCISRIALESVVRQRIALIENIKTIDNTTVNGLLPSTDEKSIIGVRITSGKGLDSQQDEILASLVVDASGRGSRASSWLKALGYNAPVEDVVSINISYASAYFSRNPDHIPGKKSISISPDVPNRYGGVMLSQGKDQWLFTLAGYLDAPMPRDHTELLQYAGKLPTLKVAEILRESKPLSDVYRYQVPSNIRKRYDKLRRFPNNLALVGDAVCSFNPIYGQGMSTAALEVLKLDVFLKSNKRNYLLFQKSVKKVTDIPWNTAVNNDLRFPNVLGKRGLLTKILHWYLPRFHKVAHSTPELSALFLKVLNLKAKPMTLLSPRVLFRVLKHNYWS
ncbi:FAD-dependent oxidoreductase [Reinekea sp.]|jgi:2-polyprenyl-6-methoxyphenol hydroxylase-like FAD-dependent oxidoreductase|uniref:FAD-dependent oxidoreductase n=1 Tax=Reinekea sp. TaxID=1970455 RepID=UPI002A82B491|nr:FAD-dependent monooxygenase [Reinekea sp.]